MRLGWLNSRVVHLSVSEQSVVCVRMLLAFSFSLFLFTLFLSSISLSLSFFLLLSLVRSLSLSLFYTKLGSLRSFLWSRTSSEVHVEVLSWCMVSSWSRWECQCSHVPWSVYTIFAYTNKINNNKSVCRWKDACARKSERRDRMRIIIYTLCSMWCRRSHRSCRSGRCEYRCRTCGWVCAYCMVEMKLINTMEQSALAPSLFTSRFLIHFSLSLLSPLSYFLFIFLSFTPECQRMGTKIVCIYGMIAMSGSLPSFLWSRSSSCIPLVRVQSKGKMKETQKNQTPSTERNTHVCRWTIAEAFVWQRQVLWLGADSLPHFFSISMTAWVFESVHTVCAYGLTTANIIVIIIVMRNI